jgi:hypothetical protein
MIVKEWALGQESLLVEILTSYRTPDLRTLMRTLKLVVSKIRVKDDLVAALVYYFQHQENNIFVAVGKEQADFRDYLNGLIKQTRPKETALCVHGQVRDSSGSCVAPSLVWLTQRDFPQPDLKSLLGQYRTQRVMEYTQTCCLLLEENLNSLYDRSPNPGGAQTFIETVQKQWFRELTVRYQLMCDDLGVALCNDNSFLNKSTQREGVQPGYYVVWLCRVLRVVLGSGMGRVRSKINQWGLGTAWTISQRLAAWSVFHPQQVALITSLVTEHQAEVRRWVEDHVVWQILPRAQSVDTLQTTLLASLETLQLPTPVPKTHEYIKARSVMFVKAVPTTSSLQNRFVEINTSALDAAFATAVKLQRAQTQTTLKYIQTLFDPVEVTLGLPKVKTQFATSL